MSDPSFLIPSSPPSHLLFFLPFTPQVTVPWSLLFAVLGVLCRIPGVLYQSSKAGVACGRFMAHMCLVQVGGRGRQAEGEGCISSSSSGLLYAAALPVR